MPRWPQSISNAPNSTASGTTLSRRRLIPQIARLFPDKLLAFRARFERAAAPLTCARFESLLPYRERLIHVRWSGEACRIPLGGLDLGLGYENATSYPALGQLLFHPGGIS